MECRCYRGDKNRTKLVKLSYRTADIIWIAATAAFLGAIIALRVLVHHIVAENIVMRILFYII